MALTKAGTRAAVPLMASGGRFLENIIKNSEESNFITKQTKVQSLEGKKLYCSISCDKRLILNRTPPPLLCPSRFWTVVKVGGVNSHPLPFGPLVSLCDVTDRMF